MTASGINIIGYASGNLGLGVVVRQLGQALLARGHAIAVHDLDAGGGRSGRDHLLQAHYVSRIDALPHAINLWVVGTDALLPKAAEICRTPSLQRQFNAVSAWWELPRLCEEWLVAARTFDAVVSGSEFMRETWSSHLPWIPSLLARTPIRDVEGALPDRAGFGLRDDAFVVFTGFEPASDIARKNPFAAIAAFRLAFPDDARVQLAIKVNNADRDPSAARVLSQLEAVAGEDGRIVLLREGLDRAPLMSLYASCDVVLSLHRAEGLGLMPLEAMHLGKPVVATGWSGNMSYMDYSNSCPVRSHLIETDPSSAHYSPQVLGLQSVWAEPDLDHAAALLRWLATDRLAYERISARARETSMEYSRVASEVRWVEELIALRDQRALVPAKDFGAMARPIAEATARLARRRELTAYGVVGRTLRQTHDVLRFASGRS